ncbi:MAG: trigger factor [Dehalococcoidia bacterium]|nr:trigger factor [Dehalococcoidia bacterium]
MKVSSEQRPSREAVLTVELEPGEAEPYLERAYKQVVGKLNIPGFRKGKAPRRIVEQLYGRDYLANQALDFMLPELTGRAMEQESVEPADLPSISLDTLELDPVKYTATVPLRPKVDLGAYRKVRIPKERVRVGKTQIDQALEDLANAAAPWEPVDGPPAYGDLLNITAYGAYFSEEHGHEHNLIASDKQDYLVRENSRAPVPGFGDKLLELAVEQETEFEIVVPDDFENTEIAGKTARFSATLHSVKRKVPAPIDDEFAKGVGEGYDTLKALREAVKSDLEQQEAQNAEARHKEEAIGKVVDGAVVEISPLIVERETDNYLMDFQEAHRTGRMTIQYYQQYLAWAGKSQEEIREDARASAEQRLRRALVLRELVDDCGVAASDEEVDAEIERMAADSGAEANRVRDMFREQTTRDSLRRMLEERKVVDAVAAIAAGEAEADPADDDGGEPETGEPNEPQTPDEEQAKEKANDA